MDKDTYDAKHTHTSLQCTVKIYRHTHAKTQRHTRGKGGHTHHQRNLHLKEANEEHAHTKEDTHTHKHAHTHTLSHIHTAEAVAKEWTTSLLSLSHPNVVKFHAIFMCAENVFAAMERVDLGRVSFHIWKIKENFGRKSQMLFVKCVVRQVVTALEYLHSRLLVHRDIRVATNKLAIKSQIYTILFSQHTEHRNERTHL